MMNEWTNAESVSTAHARRRRADPLTFSILWSVCLAGHWYLCSFSRWGTVQLYHATYIFSFLNHGWLVVGNWCPRSLRGSQIIWAESYRPEGRVKETKPGLHRHQKRPVGAVEKGIFNISIKTELTIVSSNTFLRKKINKYVYLSAV